MVIGIVGIFRNPALGLFAVGKTHNFIHIMAGVLAIVSVVRGVVAARQFAKFIGSLFSAIAIMGFLIPDKMILGVIDSSLSNNILHLVIGLSFLVVGYSGKDLMTNETQSIIAR